MHLFFYDFDITSILDRKITLVEENSSGIGFKNNWVNLKIGRGRENWGAGQEIQLALSKESGSYDYFSLYSNYGRLGVKYIHGFLSLLTIM